MRWPKVFAVLFLCIVGLKLVWALAYPTSHHRFRLTVNVETPTGLRSGSSVMETVVERFPGWVGLREGQLATPTLIGEAAFVELGSTPDGKPANLIALLAWGDRGTSGADFGDIVRRVSFDYLQANSDARNKRGSYSDLKGPVRGCRTDNAAGHYCQLAFLPIGTMKDVRGDLVPTLITLADLGDPKSATVVKPGALAETFGAGFQLKNVTLEYVTPGQWPLSIFGISGEPLTHEIESRLPKLFETFRNQPPRYLIEKIGDPFILLRSQLKVGD
jgi:hypothetical protein